MMTATARARDTFSFLLDSGLQGHHLLFDVGLIRRTFEQDAREPFDTNAEWPLRVRQALEHITQLPSLWEQRQFVAFLPIELQERLCFHYFAILDAQAAQARVTLH
jgi:hypothetical protein